MKNHVRDIQHVELICFSETVWLEVSFGVFIFIVFPSMNFHWERLRFIHSSAIRLLYESLVFKRWCRLVLSQSRFLARLHIIVVGLGLAFFICFLFHTHFNEPPFEFVSANHPLSDHVAATMAWISRLPSVSLHLFFLYCSYNFFSVCLYNCCHHMPLPHFFSVTIYIYIYIYIYIRQLFCIKHRSTNE